MLVTALAVIGSVAAQNDIDILNFALNLECLEAAFYTCATYGVPLTDAYLGTHISCLPIPMTNMGTMHNCKDTLACSAPSCFAIAGESWAAPGKQGWALFALD